MASTTFDERTVIGRAADEDPVEPHAAERGIAVACATWWSSPWASARVAAPVRPIAAR